MCLITQSMKKFFGDHTTHQRHVQHILAAKQQPRAVIRVNESNVVARLLLDDTWDGNVLLTRRNQTRRCQSWRCQYNNYNSTLVN